MDHTAHQIKVLHILEKVLKYQCRNYKW